MHGTRAGSSVPLLLRLLPSLRSSAPVANPPIVARGAIRPAALNAAQQRRPAATRRVASYAECKLPCCPLATPPPNSDSHSDHATPDTPTSRGVVSRGSVRYSPHKSLVVTCAAHKLQDELAALLPHRESLTRAKLSVP